MKSLWNYSLVDDYCYPYVTSNSPRPGKCLLPRSYYRLQSTKRCPFPGAPVRVYRAAPPYTVSPTVSILSSILVTILAERCDCNCIAKCGSAAIVIIYYMTSSVSRVYCDKTTEARIIRFSLKSRLIPQLWWRSSRPGREAQIRLRWLFDFTVLYISETVRDTA